jgi:hypothetical protein
VRNGGLGDAEEAREVDADDGGELVLGVVGEGLGEEDPRVVDQGVDAANASTPASITRRAVVGSAMSPGP